jgi:YrbI family 3-deoxy-D-manno-octulosonate 8-phosphate phosphatase
MTDIHTIAIVLARKGSEDSTDKNLINFVGKPLLGWTILQSLAAKTVDRVFVLSGNQAILDVVTEYGAVPIYWPNELNYKDDISGEALVHALDAIAEVQGVEPDTVVLLQSAYPLREASDIDGAVAAFELQQADSLFTNAVLDDVFAWHEEEGVVKGKTFDPFNRGRSQERKPLYLENSSIYVFKSELLRNTGNHLGGKIARYTMDYWKSFEINTPENVELCEYFFRRHLLPYWIAHESSITIFKADLIVYDFDGVMTDNRVLVMQDGTEAVLANRADGWGISQLRQAGYRQIILSTETNPVVSSRAKKLGLEALQGSGDKLSDLTAFCQSQGISLERVLYVGNDVNDLDAMRLVGYTVAPADAHVSVLLLAKHITNSCGGAGVIKELSELLLLPPSK